MNTDDPKMLAGDAALKDSLEGCVRKWCEERERAYSLPRKGAPRDQGLKLFRPQFSRAERKVLERTVR